MKREGGMKARYRKGRAECSDGEVRGGGD